MCDNVHWEDNNMIAMNVEYKLFCIPMVLLQMR